MSTIKLIFQLYLSLLCESLYIILNCPFLKRKVKVQMGCTTTTTATTTMGCRLATKKCLK